jgi:lambda family phage portal protein
MPIWPFTRKKQVSQSRGRGYAGAAYGRLVADWVAGTTSQDAEIKSSIVALRARSRQLCRDNDYAVSAIRAIKTNVVGTGVGMQAQVRMKRGAKLNDSLNSQIEAAWTKWKRKENCHAAGKLSFSEIERLIAGSVFESGEVLIRKVPIAMGTVKTPFTLEVIEADMLDETFDAILPNRNTVRMGVEVNAWLRPVAYYFRRKHPGDYYASRPAIERGGDRIRIPANEILHLFIPTRVNQTRGVPWMHSAMTRLHHMGGYEESEVIAARAGAAVMGFIESTEGEVPSDDVVDGERITEFSPGLFKYLAQGEKVVVPQLNRPSGSFDPFMRTQLRGFSSGVGVPYETVSSDYSQSNYSSSRLSLLDARDHWKVIQQWLIENFHAPVFEDWLDMAVLAGDVRIPDYELNRDAYHAVRWLPRGWSWIDPEKEIRAYKDGVRSGFMTQADVVAQTGGDFEDLVAQRRREVEMADEAGLVFDTNPDLIDGQGSVQAPEKSKEDEPASEDSALAPA